MTTAESLVERADLSEAKLLKAAGFIGFTKSGRENYRAVADAAKKEALWAVVEWLYEEYPKWDFGSVMQAEIEAAGLGRSEGGDS